MARAVGSSNTTKEVRDAIHEDRQNGMPIKAVARKYGVDRSVVRQWGGRISPKEEESAPTYLGPIRAGDRFRVNGRARFVWARRGSLIQLRSYENGSPLHGTVQKDVLTLAELRRCKLLRANTEGEVLAMGSKPALKSPYIRETAAQVIT